ncbi:MAG: phenylalanine--tRNA ligase subunit beta, partial [Oscillospiraceae bacterium]|nr:phenylalanine--tRNA ligase subunit beta [Oscillospiraceae bacterium]
ELDPDGCLRSLARALELIVQLDAGDIVGDTVDVFPSPKPARTIPFTPDWVNGFIGINCPAETQIAILEKIGCTIHEGKIAVPGFRNDLEDKADIAEEIARFYGYDKIPATPLQGLADGRLTETQQLQRQLSETLLALGCSEVQTYSFISPKAYDKLGLPPNCDERRSVVISNPLGEDTSVMRTTALPSMLEVLARNQNARNESAALFELATVYLPRGTEELPQEKQKLIIGLYGPDENYFSLKGIVEQLLARTGIAGYDVTAATDREAFHPGRTAKLTLDGKKFALLGEVAPAVQANFGIGTRVYVAVIDFDTLLNKRSAAKLYRQLPRYPAITRDLALVCDAATPVLALQKAIESAAGALLEKLTLFDVYTGSQIAAGSKGIAYSLRLRSAKGTLTDEEADVAVKRCTKALEKIGAALRIR